MTKRRLPPDPEGMNDHHAICAERSLWLFTVNTGVDWCDVLQDLLADIMHLCDRDDELDFERDLDRARAHYAEETRKGGGR